MARLEWQKLLSPVRFSDRLAPPLPHLPVPDWAIPHQRTSAERDFDRVLYATPIRRLADKTQVFPLEENISIRTRLTHSHEVANLARAVGLHLVHAWFPKIEAAEQMPADYRRDIPAMLATVGLAHDMGNPPFGHTGEEAIGSWFRQKIASDSAFALRFGEIAKPDDFLKFEGNAQTLRLLTKLQVGDRSFGFNLTCGTLGAMMKYTVGSDRVNPAVAATKKFGFFASERETATMIFAETGLVPGLRHPLAFIMEACDDIAYTVLDTEDMVKKRLVTFGDVMDWLQQGADDVIDYVVAKSKNDRETHALLGLSEAELDDVSMQGFRTHAIHAMVTHLIHAFDSQYEDIMQGRQARDLIACSGVARLRDRLKEFDRRHGYESANVRQRQQNGIEAIHRLMDRLWVGIAGQHEGDKAAEIYLRISENYRRQFEKDKAGTIFTAQCRLLTDMVSGMTDSYTISLGDALTQMAA